MAGNGSGGVVVTGDADDGAVAVFDDFGFDVDGKGVIFFLHFGLPNQGLLKVSQHSLGSYLFYVDSLGSRRCDSASGKGATLFKADLTAALQHGDCAHPGSRVDL